MHIYESWSFHGGSDSKESTCNAGDPDLIPWRKEWLPTPVFLPGEFQGQRSLVGYGPWGHKELDMTEWLTHTRTHTHTHTEPSEIETSTSTLQNVWLRSPGFRKSTGTHVLTPTWGRPYAKCWLTSFPGMVSKVGCMESELHCPCQ